ncbi:MAG: hypothetical protein ACERKT_09105 [Acidobacteriota bacterium]
MTATSVPSFDLTKISSKAWVVVSVSTYVPETRAMPKTTATAVMNERHFRAQRFLKVRLSKVPEGF